MPFGLDLPQLLDSDPVFLRVDAGAQVEALHQFLSERAAWIQMEYVEGLKLYHPGAPTEELVKMVRDHPAFQQLDAQANADPRMAERYFSKGLEFFWQRKYPEAEAQFAQAKSFYETDARYHYFLGLARFQQKDRKKLEAAKFDLTEGARLEALSRPDAVRVNASLERVQGALRQMIADYRQKAGIGPD